MSAGSPGEDDERGATDEVDAEDVADLRDRLDALSAEVESFEADVDAVASDLESFEDDVEERTVHRSAIEEELRAYVRRRLRRGHARGWGPYLVLLYGTIMTLGAFYYLDGGWAIAAMLVLWLSTLGLYALMLIVGAGIGLLSVPGRAAEVARTLRR